ncbi:MAG: hypothetical protein WC631_00960 [Candidatus Paceibacterota bacterium]|jgi:hypothetical protein
MENQPFLPEFEIGSQNIPVQEKDQCQYCQDGGPCIYCDRGKKFIQENKEELTSKRKTKKGK